MSDLLSNLYRIKKQFDALFTEVECLQVDADALNEARYHKGLDPIDNSYEIWDHIYTELGEVQSVIKFSIERATIKKYMVDVDINYTSRIWLSAPLTKDKAKIKSEVESLINNNIHTAFAINLPSDSYIDAEFDTVNVYNIHNDDTMSDEAIEIELEK